MDFFGARFLPLPSPIGLPSFYGLSYMGSNATFHNGTGFDAVITPAQVDAGMGSGVELLPESGPRGSYVAAHGYAPLTRNGHYGPLSWNSRDIDGDGLVDFSFGGLIYLSSSGFASPAWSTSQVGAEVAFLETQQGVRAVRLKNGRLSVARYQAGWGFVEEGLLQVSQPVTNGGHSLTILPGELISLRLECGLQTYRFAGTAIVPGACISGLSGNWALLGGRGDFDGDGIEDIWISQTMLGSGTAPADGFVSLVSGAQLASATGVVSLASMTIARIDGSTQFSDYDGIATTMSPVAGDIDGDGLPDFSFSGHRHMSEAGAMYILRGSDFVPGMHISIDDPRIIKVAGRMMSQLAPPFHHWDASDFNGDGHDDIVVSADNDLTSGLSAGAVYVLSGAAISAASP